MSFNPSVSHYRREHAPNRKYLPSDLSEKYMFEQYQKSHEPELQVSYAYYCRVLKRLNIALVKLGNEQCEKCEIGKQHKKDFNPTMTPVPMKQSAKYAWILMHICSWQTVPERCTARTVMQLNVDV